MTLHREGYTILSVSGVLFIIFNLLSFYFLGAYPIIQGLILATCIVFYILFLQFFRLPRREFVFSDNAVIAPCDGKVVVIEETFETEYLKDKRIQVSIFMSPINVHANWYPVSGRISYIRYHVGKYLVAWHPKASTDNERTTIVIEKDNKVEILVRQIAGALAKRIVYYPHENDKVRQGSELGFIKFGSRMDIYLPVGTKIVAQLEQKTKGGVTVIAELV